MVRGELKQKLEHGVASRAAAAAEENTLECYFPQLMPEYWLRSSQGRAEAPEKA